MLWPWPGLWAIFEAVFGIVVALLLQVSGLTSIAEANRLARRASDAMRQGQYAAAARDYSQMADGLGVKNDAVLANLGLAHLRLGDYANATRAYTRLSISGDAQMRSLAHAQLGVIASRQKNPGEAANQLKEALRQDPNNQLARLNLARLLSQNPKLQPPPQSQNQKQQQNQQQNQQQQQSQNQQQQQPQNKQQQDQQQQDDKKPKPDPQKQGQQPQKDQEAGNQNGQNQQRPEGQTDAGQSQKRQGAQGKGPVDDAEQGKGDEGKKPQEAAQGRIANREQLRQMQLSEERARQLLEAMRSGEVQYLQQRRNRRSNPSNNGRPDW